MEMRPPRSSQALRVHARAGIMNRNSGIRGLQSTPYDPSRQRRRQVLDISMPRINKEAVRPVVERRLRQRWAP